MHGWRKIILSFWVPVKKNQGRADQLQVRKISHVRVGWESAESQAPNKRLTDQLNLKFQQWQNESFLVGGWTNPFEKYARQNGNLPQIGVKIPKIFELPPPSFVFCWSVVFFSFGQHVFVIMTTTTFSLPVEGSDFASQAFPFTFHAYPPDLWGSPGHLKKSPPAALPHAPPSPVNVVCPGSLILDGGWNQASLTTWAV